MTSFINSKVLASIFAFVPIFGLHCLNFVAMELENPFGTDVNDLPLINFQTEMNNCLMMLLHPKADLIPNVSSRCETDFFELKENVQLIKSMHANFKRQSAVDEATLPRGTSADSKEFHTTASLESSSSKGAALRSTSSIKSVKNNALTRRLNLEDNL